jgi:septum formation protein
VTAVGVRLVSASPRRLAILAMLGLDARVVRPAPVERPHAPPEPAVPYAVGQALAKLESVGPPPAGWLALAADTIVILEGRVLGKPADAAEARAMLRALSGRTHEVVTGLAVAHAGRAASGWESTRVTFRGLRGAEIERYVAGGEPLDKAGAYGIQGAGSALVRGVEGCYFNVVGLPVARLVDLLGEVGLHYDLSGAVVSQESAAAP